MIWKEKRILLLILGLLLAANAIFFLTYRVQYQTRLDDLDVRLEEAEASVLNARNSRMRTERDLTSHAKVEDDVTTVYEQHWATRAERLTALITEVKRLGQASGLVPSSYSFDQAEIRTAPALQSREKQVGATEVGMSFTVQGTYAQTRRLINLLELSQQFVIIDGIKLASSDSEILTLNLHIKTIFRDEKPVATGRRL
jgi:hypothetical protein